MDRSVDTGSLARTKKICSQASLSREAIKEQDESKVSRTFEHFHFVETLEQMSSYARCMKQILSKKKRLEEFKIVALNGECSVVLQ